MTQDVLFQALELQDSEESWLALHQQEVSEKIDRGLAQIDRGGGMTPEQSLPWAGRKQVSMASQSEPMTKFVVAAEAASDLPQI